VAATTAEGRHRLGTLTPRDVYLVILPAARDGLIKVTGNTFAFASTSMPMIPNV